MFRIRTFALITCIVAALSNHQSARAASLFTETFSTDSTNWFNPQGSAPAQWSSLGGPDNSPHITTSYNFQSLTPGLPFPNNAVNLFRAQDEFNSSNHAFEGDWLAAGITQFSFDFRHTMQTGATVFVRFATAGNFPAFSGVQFTPVAANTWTHITIDINLANPALFHEGPPAGPMEFASVFKNVGHIQIGVFAGNAAGTDQTYTFQLDNVATLPAPGALSLLALGWSCVICSRRRRALNQNDCDQTAATRGDR